MLAQAVVAAYERPERDGYHRGQLTVTGVSPCPYATYLNFKHLDDEPFDAESRLRMKNGKWQEMEVLEDLRRAGFQLKFTGSNQLTVVVGPVRGRPDGLITVDSREDLLEVKAMSIGPYTSLKQKGLQEAHPGYFCQVQLYMASDELRDRVSGCWFYVKHKDSCRPYDVFIEKDLVYSKPIIEFVTEIVNGAEISKPAECPLPAQCRHTIFCQGVEIFDTSGIKIADIPAIVEKWLEGQFHLAMGKELNEEARTLLKQVLGDNETTLCQGEDALLQVKRIIQHRSEIDMGRFVEAFGASRLPEVMVDKIVEQIRVTRRD